MTQEPKKTIQQVLGLVASLAFLGLAYLSMQPTYELTWPVIVGCVVIIAMLLGKLDDLADLIDKWKR